MTDENDSKYVGDEFVEDEEAFVEEEEGNEMEGLYDLVLPPGVPHKLIIETVEKFNLEISTRKYGVKTLDLDEENLLVLRGELEAVNQAHDYIHQKLKEKYSPKGN